jgi:hypothetical protein
VAAARPKERGQGDQSPAPGGGVDKARQKHQRADDEQGLPEFQFHLSIPSFAQVATVAIIRQQSSKTQRLFLLYKLTCFGNKAHFLHSIFVRRVESAPRT